MYSIYSKKPVHGYNTIGMRFTYTFGAFGELNPPLTILGYDEKSGFGNPIWRTQVKDKVNATTPYTRSWYRTSVEKPKFHLKVSSTSNPIGVEFLGNVRPSPYTSAILFGLDKSVIDDIALKKIKAKIASDKGDFAVMSNMLQDIYELRKTIVGPMQSISSLIRNVLNMFEMFSRNRMSRTALIQDVGNLWLAWSFGIKPTLADAAELSESIQAFLNRKDHIKHFGASHYGEVFDSLNSTLRTGYVDLNTSTAIARRYSCRYLDARLINFTSGLNYAALNEQFHLSWSDFVPTLWELLPWTWLFDYVWNVGEVLTDLFQSSSDQSKYVVKTTKDEYIVSTDMQPVPMAGYHIDAFNHDSDVHNFGSFVRSTHPSLPRRIFRFHTKYEIEKNLVNKTLNLISVAAGRTRAHHFR